MSNSPTLNGHPIRLELLAPNMRPVQVTTDLPSFWASGYPQIRKDMRGRYPKHPWPEDPIKASPAHPDERKPPRISSDGWSSTASINSGHQASPHRSLVQIRNEEFWRAHFYVAKRTWHRSLCLLMSLSRLGEVVRSRGRSDMGHEQHRPLRVQRANHYPKIQGRSCQCLDMPVGTQHLCVRGTEGLCPALRADYHHD